MRARHPYLDTVQRELVCSWWEALQPKEEAGVKAEVTASKTPKAHAKEFVFTRGDRAQLRRAISVQELMLAGAPHALTQRLLALESHKSHPRLTDSMAVYQRLATTCGLLAHIKEDAKNGQSLAWQLGYAPKRSGKDKGKEVLMSELRFKRLLKATDLDDLYRQLVRALKLAEGKVDVGQFADDALAYLTEMERPASNPAQSVKLYWAHDYYLRAKDQAGAINDSEE